MLELGQVQTLRWKRTTEHGAYVGEPEEEEDVLLPKKYLPEGRKQGDDVEVFLYRDSEDRLVATTQMPLLKIGELAVLTVLQVTGIGAFLDWGLDKDLLLPFKEQTRKLHAGDRCLSALYVDKSNRLCATMKVYNFLKCAPEGLFRTGDYVEGVIYEIKPELGALVAVENCYHGMIPGQEFFQDKKPGDQVRARILKIREDGKLDLTLRDKAYLQIDIDAAAIMERLKEKGGTLPFNDKASPLVIQKEFGISKNAFKRAVGRLLKTEKIQVTDHEIKLMEK